MRLRFAALLILLLVLVLSLSSCKTVVEYQYQEVDALITDTYHRDGYLLPAGKIMVWHPSVNEVTLQYGEITTTIDNFELYSICLNRIGDTAPCILVTEIYDDGSQKQFLKWSE